ncbi:MAG: YwbE family protein [Promethearchaeota archaeon]
MKGTKRADIKSGMRVLIVLKKDQRSGKLTEGFVKDVLTNSPNHHHGIKVRLRSGEIGRVKKIVN